MKILYIPRFRKDLNSQKESENWNNLSKMSFIAQMFQSTIHNENISTFSSLRLVSLFYL